LDQRLRGVKAAGFLLGGAENFPGALYLDRTAGADGIAGQCNDIGLRE
jgi:hypothetical protein